MKLIFNRLVEEEENTEIKKFISEEKVEKESIIELIKNFFTKESLTKKENISRIICSAVMINAILLVINYPLSLYKLEPVVLSNNLLYILISAGGPFLFWIYSTSIDFWQYHNRKKLLFDLAIANCCLTVMQPLYTLLWNIIVVNILKTPVTVAMNEGLIVLTAQEFLGIAVIGIFAIAYAIIKPIVIDDKADKNIKTFKIEHYLDKRENKENLYDLKIIRDLETGAQIPITEGDRNYSSLLIGASGTGKTSTYYKPGIKNDMEIKAKNRDERTKLLVEMLVNHEAVYMWPTVEFEEYKVVPKERYKDKYRAIYKKYPDCGIFVMAPNNSLINDAVKLAEARHLKVNVLDPEKYYENKNVTNCLLNAFDIPFGLEEEIRRDRIYKAADTFAAVLVAVSERTSSNPQLYFSQLAQAVIQHVATILMLSRNIEGKQTNVKEIGRCIENVSLLKPHIDVIEKYYNIKVIVENNKEKNQRGNVDADMLENKTNESAHTFYEKAEDNLYWSDINFAKRELLGEGAANMFDQCRGLRTMIGKLTGDPQFMKLFAGSNAHINFDKALSESEITLVNTGAGASTELSTEFGLYCLLFLQVAIRRRPDDYRPCHFVWIDELSQYMHESLEDYVALFRQYGIYSTFAIQSGEQFKKNKKTEYLGSVFQTVGTIIVFGRVSPDDAKRYEEMAGKRTEEIIQHTISKTSMLSDAPTEGWSDRTTPTVKNAVEGSEIRYLDFKEIVVFTCKNGRVLEPKFGKLGFLDDNALKERIPVRVQMNLLGKKLEYQQQEEECNNTSLMVDDLKNLSTEGNVFKGTFISKYSMPQAKAEAYEVDEVSNQREQQESVFAKQNVKDIAERFNKLQDPFELFKSLTESNNKSYNYDLFEDEDKELFDYGPDLTRKERSQNAEKNVSNSENEDIIELRDLLDSKRLKNNNSSTKNELEGSKQEVDKDVAGKGKTKDELEDEINDLNATYKKGNVSQFESEKPVFKKETSKQEDEGLSPWMQKIKELDHQNRRRA